MVPYCKAHIRSWRPSSFLPTYAMITCLLFTIVLNICPQRRRALIPIDLITILNLFNSSQVLLPSLEEFPIGWGTKRALNTDRSCRQKNKAKQGDISRVLLWCILKHLARIEVFFSQAPVRGNQRLVLMERITVCQGCSALLAFIA